MTGEHDERDEQADLDAEGFILDDWDDLEGVLAEVDDVSHRIASGSESASGAPEEDQPHEDESSAEDILFDAQGLEPESGETPFSEEGPGWAGRDVAAEDIGIPVDGERAVDDDDLVLDEDLPADDPLAGAAGAFEDPAAESPGYEADAAESDTGDLDLGEFVTGDADEGDFGAGDPADGDPGAVVADAGDFEPGGFDAEPDEVAPDGDDFGSDRFGSDDLGSDELGGDDLEFDQESTVELDDQEDDESFSQADDDDTFFGDDADDEVPSSSVGESLGALEEVEIDAEPDGELDSSGFLHAASESGLDAEPESAQSVGTAFHEISFGGDGGDEGSAAAGALGALGGSRTNPPVEEVDLELEEQGSDSESGFFQDASEAQGDWEQAELGEDGGLAPSYDADGEEVDPDWAPAAGQYDLDDDESFASDENDDPIYGKRAEGVEDDEEEVYDEEPDYAEYDENYVDGHAGGPQLARHGAPPRRWLPKVAAGLAAVLIVGAGAVTVLQPEWLGMRTAPPALVDRTPVARPELDLALAVPELAPPEQPRQTDPVVLPPEVATGPVPAPPGGGGDEKPPEPVQPPEVVANGPEMTPVPGTGEPGATPTPEGGTEPVQPPAVERPEVAAVPVPTDLIGIGEEMQVGGRVADEPAPVKSPVPATVVAGDQAFAQLHNGNFFVGNVKAIHEDTLTLAVDQGEVSLRFDEVSKIGSVQSAEYMALRKSEPGFVRLTNDNRLVGSIVRDGANGSVTLDLKSNRIIIPATEIEEVGSERPSGVKIDQEEGEQWIRELIERRIEHKGGGVEVPAGGKQTPKQR